MRTTADLERTLHSIDGRGYGGYKQLRGTYDMGPLDLGIDRVQTDPYAPPSLMRITIARDTAGFDGPDFDPALLDDETGRIAVGDFLTRRFAEAARSGHGAKGPRVSIGRPGQEVLERTSILIAEDRIEARFSAELPAAGRRALGRQAATLLTQRIPDIAAHSLMVENFSAADKRALAEHVELLRDQMDLRSQLHERDLVAFVGNGSILPRRSGDSDAPLEHGAVPFESPQSLNVSFTLRSGRTVTGMGVPAGVTVIVGGGYHGKSTLLRAIERGVYPHIGSDGREWVISRPDAVAIRAEDGRSVADVDISAFIADLPSGADTTHFSTTNASGSTSQATNLSEAVEAGTTALLIDEDTSATNFMIRDERMRQLIPADREPITPFVDRVRPLYQERGVSTVLVAGGSGAFFDVADHVIAMDDYVPQDVTAEALQIAQDDPEGSAAAGSDSGSGVFAHRQDRIPQAHTLEPKDKRKPAKAAGRSAIRFGREDIDLAAVSQLVDVAQTQAIAHALDRLGETFNGEISLVDGVAELNRLVDEKGLDALSPYSGNPGNYARPRTFEICAAVNRYRLLRIRGEEESESTARTAPDLRRAFNAAASASSDTPRRTARRR